MRIPINESQLGFIHKHRVNEWTLRVTFEKSEEGDTTFADFKREYNTNNFEGTETKATPEIINLFKNFKFKIPQ